MWMFFNFRLKMWNHGNTFCKVISFESNDHCCDIFSVIVIYHVFQIRELGPELGNPTSALSVAVPPFQYEINNLKAMTWYNMSVSCTNEIGSSPPSAWVQSNTTEGGECPHGLSPYILYILHTQVLNVFSFYLGVNYHFKLEGFLQHVIMCFISRCQMGMGVNL